MEMIELFAGTRTSMKDEKKQVETITIGFKPFLKCLDNTPVMILIKLI